MSECNWIWFEEAGEIELVSDGELRALKERDKARAARYSMTGDYNRLSIDNCFLRDEIAALRAQLAAFKDPEPEPPAHNPFAVKPRDPRRMGP